MQRTTEESEGSTEVDRKNIRSPASEPVGRETGTSWSVCVSVCVFVCENTGMHVHMRGVELGQLLLLLLEPQLVQLSAEKGTEETRRKEEEVWEKKEEEERLGGISEDIPVPMERLWEHGERRRKGVR